MLKIRLQRVGRKNDPSFRVVVIDSHRGPKAGRAVELLGSHRPRQHATALKKERILYWLSKGAQASGTVHNLLIAQGVREGKKVNVLPRHTAIAKEQTKEQTTDNLQPTATAEGPALGATVLPEEAAAPSSQEPRPSEPVAEKKTTE